MKYFVLSLLIFNVFAGKHLSSEHESTLKELFNYMKKSTHKKLGAKGLKMKFYRLDNPQYFMESNFHIVNRVIRGKKDYKIGVNPLIFDSGISEEALMGVFAHELIHTEDYESGKLAKVAYAYAVGGKTKKRYERGTDLRVIFKGFGHHLIEYKKFQYPKLTKEALIKKKKQYLTPEEINFVRDAREQIGYQNDKKLLSFWLKKMPLSYEEFESSFQKFLDEELDK